MKMATINFAFFFLTLSALLQAYHARQLNDGYLYVRFDRRPPLQAAEVIQMVTRKQEQLQSPPPFYGRDNPKSPPSPQVAPPRGEATYGQVKPKPPPSPRVAPSHGEKTYGGENPKLPPPSPETEESDHGGQNGYGRVNPKSPPSPEVAPSRGQTTYGGENPKSPPSSGKTIYGGDDRNLAPPEAAKSGHGGRNGYGRETPGTPPSPEVAPPEGETTYGGGNTNSKNDVVSDPSDPVLQSGYGRVDPKELTQENPLSQLAGW